MPVSVVEREPLSFSFSLLSASSAAGACSEGTRGTVTGAGADSVGWGAAAGVAEAGSGASVDGAEETCGDCTGSCPDC